ncbi:alpha/beta hydrolase [Flavobacteriaceae bacterium 3-367]|uniref:alpha/beta fold hydrolase n=1 Tax=Eudoraea algarum TaxID=3417568 RepID=UPI0032816683
METDHYTKQNRLLDTKTVRLKKLDLKIQYAELGQRSNPTVVLLHGVPENLQAWYDVAPHLAGDYHLLAIDWPGFGGSEPLPRAEAYTSSFFAKVVVDFMDTMQISKAALMATDIGLLPAFIVGLEHPGRVSKLVVMDGIPFPRPQYNSWELKSFARKGSIRAKALIEWFPKISAQIAYHKGFYKGHTIPREIQEAFLRDGRNKSTQIAFKSYFQNFREQQKRFERRAHELNVPTLILWGKHDRFIHLQLGHEIEEKLPNAKLQIIDRAGHYVHMDKPQEVVRHFMQFMDEFQGSPKVIDL